MLAMVGATVVDTCVVVGATVVDTCMVVGATLEAVAAVLARVVHPGRAYTTRGPVRSLCGLACPRWLGVAPTVVLACAPYHPVIR